MSVTPMVASLQLPEARETIARAMPLIASDFTRTETAVHGVLGLSADWPARPYSTHV